MSALVRRGLPVAAALAVAATMGASPAVISSAASAPHAHRPAAARPRHAARQPHHVGRRSSDPKRTQAKPQSRVADPLPAACTSGIIFNVAGTQQTSGGPATGDIYSLNVATGVNTFIGRFSSGTSPINGLGVTTTLSAAYAVAQGGGGTVYTHLRDGANSSQSTGTHAVASMQMVMGAVDPANGIYYYAGYSGTTLAIFGYNPALTGSARVLGRVANVPGLPSGFTTGDLAFDATGHMFFVTGTNNPGGSNTSQIRVLEGTLPASSVPSPVTIGSREVAQKTAVLGGFYNGIAFGADGTLYAQYATSGTGSGATATQGTATLEVLNPSTLATIDTIPQGGAVPFGLSILTDLAGCSLPSTLTLRKDLPGGRARPQDQFTIGITRGGITTANTTAGAAAGIQAQQVVLPAVPSTVYTISESLAPGSGSTLSEYSPHWECVYAGTTTVVADGSGDHGTFTFPALSAGATAGHTVVCTFTNTPGPPGISIVKTAFPTEFGGTGELIKYKYVIKNTGDVALHTIELIDDPFGVIKCPRNQLLPGESMTCIFKHITNEDDVEAGHIDNTGTVTGRSPVDEEVSADDSATVKFVHAPAIQIEKDPFPTEYAVPGEPIEYTFTVVNTGNVPLHNIVVRDSVLGLVTCPSTTLAVGAEMECTAIHKTTVADVDRGHINNVVTVTGRGPTGETVTGKDQATVTAIHAPGIEIEKTASPGTVTAAGQRITYTYRVANVGNVTLHNVTVTDSRIGTVSCPRRTLAAGAEMTCTATTTTTAADLAKGNIPNFAIARGRTPTGREVTDEAEALVLALLPEVPVTG